MVYKKSSPHHSSNCRTDWRRLIRDRFSHLFRALRRDRRFMALAARMGLVDYWRTSGHWPDFRAEPGLPYDCKAAAARVSGGHLRATDG
jgi:hypothetical protein